MPRPIGFVDYAVRVVRSARAAIAFAARRRTSADCPLPSVATAGGLRTFSLGRGAAARHSSAAMDGPRGLFWIGNDVHGLHHAPSTGVMS